MEQDQVLIDLSDRLKRLEMRNGLGNFEIHTPSIDMALGSALEHMGIAMQINAGKGMHSGSIAQAAAMLINDFYGPTEADDE